MTIPFLRYIKYNIIPIDIPAIRICDYLYDFIGFKETISLIIFDSEYYCIINFNKNQFPFNFDEKIDHIKFRKLLFFNENKYYFFL